MWSESSKLSSELIRKLRCCHRDNYVRNSEFLTIVREFDCSFGCHKVCIKPLQLFAFSNNVWCCCLTNETKTQKSFFNYWTKCLSLIPHLKSTFLLLWKLFPRSPLAAKHAIQISFYLSISKYQNTQTFSRFKTFCSELHNKTTKFIASST